MDTVTFKLKLTTDGKDEEIEVVMQGISPFVSADVFTTNQANGYIKKGSAVKEFVNVGAIMSPKNILERIENSENAFEAIGKLYNELNLFLGSPKRYREMQRESKENA